MSLGQPGPYKEFQVSLNYINTVPENKNDNKRTYPVCDSQACVLDLGPSNSIKLPRSSLH